jgi:hypothetical protein
VYARNAMLLTAPSSIELLNTAKEALSIERAPIFR